MPTSKDKASTEKVAENSVYKDLGQVAKQAYVDIANTYQAVLMQDTGWTRQGILPELTQETSERNAREDSEKSIEPEQPAPGKDDYVIE